MKRLLHFLLAVSVMTEGLLFANTAGADQWSPFPEGIPIGESGVAVAEATTFFSFSYFASTVIQADGSNVQAECTILNPSTGCFQNMPSTITTLESEMPACTSATQTNCVASLSIGKSPSSMVASTLTGSAPGPTTNENDSLNAPAGGTASLWTNETSAVGGTNSYAVVADLFMYFNARTGKFYFPPAGFGSFPLQLKVVPYAIEPLQYVTAPELHTYEESNGISNSSYQTDAPPSCAWTDTNECAAEQDFVPGTNVSVSIRVSNQIGGFFNARMQAPQISVSKFDETSNLISVSGATVAVPQLVVLGSPNDPAIQKASDGFAESGGGFTESSSSQQGLSSIDELRAIANNTATATVNDWNFSTTSTTGNPCLTNTSQVLGIVATNAMGTDGNAPTFANGFLSYNVAGMHYLPDGSLALGTYDLVMADSVARCLYGFSTAPISATISVSENNGTENVATTKVTDQGGWLHLAAYGFTFSDPVIKVKLNQKADRKRRATIDCARGIIFKQITGIDPKCPAGFQAT